MSCGPVDARFRLLDAWVGWSEAQPPDGLAGLDDPAGLRLAQLDAGAVGGAVWQYLLPPRLAHGCGRCDWYLLAPGPARLLQRDACLDDWQPLWSHCCDPARFTEPVAVAAWQHRVAVADPGARRIWVWGRDGALLLAEITAPGIAAIGYTACGELLAATAHELLRFGTGGEPCRTPLALPALAGRPYALAGDDEGGVWMVERLEDASLRLWHLAAAGHGFVPASLAMLQAAPLRPTGITAVSTEGFCLVEPQRSGVPLTRCWSWQGCAPAGAITTHAPAALHTSGSLATGALDSGMARCRWHRVQLDADVPPGTALALKVASSDDPLQEPHADDWQTMEAGTDFLVDQPPGRYLFVQLLFSGDGRASPVLRRVRLDFPRMTSLDALPPVFRATPRAEDFTERFLSLFDAGVGELDDALDQFPAALDGASGRSELLPWLAGFLDLAFDPAWEPARQRAILAALPRLYRLRGTVAGLQLAIRLVFDVEVAISETALERPWGAVGDARLGGVRLYGKARARLALGRSTLSAAPLNSRGNPDLDPLASGAYRFVVLAPPGPPGQAVWLQRLQRLVESQKPAHTQATVRVGGSGFVLGARSAVGVDSVLGPLPAPVLGSAGTVRLGRMSVLWPARRGGHSSFVLDDPVVVGVQTVLE